MIIKNIRFKNFRSIREQYLNFENLTILVGRNGSGKSSVLHAIKTFYDVAALITEEDFFERDMGSPIEIQVTYLELREEEKKEFSTYIVDNELTVTKKIFSENGRILQRYYASALQVPEFAEIRAISGKRDRVSAWNKLIESNVFANLTKNARSAEEVEKLQDEYEKKHPELMRQIEREEQFFGPPTIGGGKLDKFTKFVLVPAVREASDEVTGKKGAIYQILDMIVLRKINSRKDIRDFKLEFDKRIKEIYCSKNLTELPELGISISKTLSKFAPGSQLRLKWDDIKTPDIPLPTAIASLTEDNFEGVIDRKGHGLQRSLILTLLQHLAMSIPIENALNENNMQELEKVEPLPQLDLILAIEEPELYLHPSRCRYLSEILLTLSEKSVTDLSARNQLIYATHSPYFIDLNRFNDIRIVRKIPSPDSEVMQSTFTSFTLEKANKILSEACDGGNTYYSTGGFRARAMSVINTIVNEGFFADVVLIVEGLSEVGTFWKLQEIMSKNWSGLGISIIPAGGKRNICHPTIIFRGFEIPTYFIFDGDSNCRTDKREENIKSNHLYLHLANAPIEDFPDTQVNSNWAVFKDNLEKNIMTEIGENNFNSIRDKIADELGYDEPSRVNKNIEGASRFIEHIYKEKMSLPSLEQIVNNVTKLKV